MSSAPHLKSLPERIELFQGKLTASWSYNKDIYKNKEYPISKIHNVQHQIKKLLNHEKKQKNVNQSEKISKLIPTRNDKDDIISMQGHQNTYQNCATYVQEAGRKIEHVNLRYGRHKKYPN